MLENSMTKDPNSIEELFCLPFSQLPVTPMTLETTELFMRLIMIEKDGSMPNLEETGDELPFAMKLIKSFLKNRFTFRMTEPLQLIMAQISGSAGNVVMYLTYLQYKAKRLDKRTLSIEDLANIFPFGFPTDAVLQDIWDSQKVKRSQVNPMGSDNLLDYQAALQSIHFSEES
jgi:hypothetical protein|tara:strand:+ start:3417 stop:3935 length:519 start_codon:yes stop_codon:yes gene_type:complete